MSNEGLTREFLAERDFRIFQMRKSGMSTQEISKRFGVSTKAVNYAIQRQLNRMNQEALLAYPEVLRMELERLDALQQSVWPMTQHRRIAAPDGSEVVVEPDLRAVQQALSIMDRRAKLLGMEAININIINESVGSNEKRAVLAEAADVPAAADEFDPEQEAKRLIELMSQAGVLPPETSLALLSGEAPQQDIEYAEVIENDDGPITPEVIR
jgi:tRNA(Glu) U13 pseudouridine synthase TruD